MAENPNTVSPSFLGSGQFVVAGWTIDPRSLTITKGDETRHLETKVMALLVCLASRPGEAMTRRELEEQVWSDMVVGYDSLTKAITKLRQRLGDHTKPRRIIETVPKVGYRLIAEVHPNTQSGGEPIPVTVESCDQDKAPPGRPPPANPHAWTHRPLPITAVVFVLLLSVVSLLAWRPWAPDFEPVSAETMALPLPDSPSIAVLPFDNLSGDPEQDFLGEGLSENIISELSRFGEFFVVAYNSTMVYKDNPVKVGQVAKDLGVHYVLEGSVQTDGDQVRVSTQLNEALSGKHVWAERFDRHLQNVFKIQDEITRSIVMSLEVNIDLAEFDRARSKPLENLKAYELIVLGRNKHETWERNGNHESKQLFERTLEIRPEHPKALVGLAQAHLMDYRRGWSDSKEDSLDLAFKYAHKAVAVAPFDHRAHWIVGKVNKHAGHLDKAAVEYDKMMKLNSNDAGLLAESADLLVALGRPEEAISRVETAMRLNPRHPDWYYWSLADAQYFAGQYEAALTSLREMTNMPNVTRRLLAGVLVRLGRVDEARAVIGEFRKESPDYTLEDVRPYYQRKEYDDRWIEDLRKAGVPER